jgi:hypothetical protein
LSADPQALLACAKVLSASAHFPGGDVQVPLATVAAQIA